ncbi:hypothetical protein J3A64_003246 [Pseudarthrobacter sp. PvP004]|nr:hypothetical protein [Pseudarthrobacter sp. PvP004]
MPEVLVTSMPVTRPLSLYVDVDVDVMPLAKAVVAGLLSAVVVNEVVLFSQSVNEVRLFAAS